MTAIKFTRNRIVFYFVFILGIIRTLSGTSGRVYGQQENGTALSGGKPASSAQASKAAAQSLPDVTTGPVPLCGDSCDDCEDCEDCDSCDDCDSCAC